MTETLEKGGCESDRQKGDLMLDDYRALEEHENYFENKKTDDCGIPHFRNGGSETFNDDAKILEILETFREKKEDEKTELVEIFDNEANPLKNVSTTALKAELRRRKRQNRRFYSRDNHRR